MRQFTFRLMLFILLITQLSLFNPAQTKSDSTNKQFTPKLQRGVAVERELKGGEVQAYELTLSAGQFARTVVVQRGIDVVVAVSAPDGKQLSEIDGPNGAYGPEEVLFVANKAGNYRLEVRPLEKVAAAAAGRYEIKNEELRAATPQEVRQDKARVFAAKLADAKVPRFSIRWSNSPAPSTVAEVREELLKKYEDLVTVELVHELNLFVRRLCHQRDLDRAFEISQFTLGIAQQLGDKPGTSDAFYNIGHIYYLQDDDPKAFLYPQNSRMWWLRSPKKDDIKALEYQQKSLVLREAPRDNRKIADSLNLIGSIYSRQNNLPQALEFYGRSLALYQETGDSRLIADTLFKIGTVHQSGEKNALALEAFQKSVPFIEATGNKELLARTLFNTGWINFLQDRYSPALEDYRKSLKLSEELGDRLQTAATLSKMTLAYRLQGDLSQALEHAQKSLALGEPLGDKELLADIAMNNGLVQSDLGNTTRALEFFQKSLALSEESGNKSQTANALEKIGNIHFIQGDSNQALENYLKSLKLSEELKNKRQIAFATVHIGEVHAYRGNYAEALEYFHRSLKVSQELGHKFSIAYALDKIGNVHLSLGSQAEALEHFRKGLALREEINNLTLVVQSVNSIGRAYLLKGDTTQALEYFQRSLKLSEKSGSKRGMQFASNLIAKAYHLQGNYSRALEYSQKGLTLTEETGARANIPLSLNIIGNIYLSQNNYAQALEYAERAAATARQTNNGYELWNALLISGQAFRALNQLDKSRQAFEEAINIIELNRQSIAGQDARATYFATAQRPYELYIDLLMHLHRERPGEGHQATALQISERARARSLLELLNEARADIRQGVDSELLWRELSLQQKLNERAEQQTRLLSGKHTAEQADGLKKEIDALTAEYKITEAQIRRQSPRYAALTQPQPLRLAEIQQEILDRDTVLLEYALGEKQSYLWAVTKHSVASYELPPRAEIEAAVKSAYALLSDGELVIDDKAQSRYQAEAGRLSQMLLAPVAAQLPNKRILVVADGALQYLPFGALPSPTAKNRQPLIVENEIVNLPSVSALAVLRRQLEGRAPAPKTLAVLADPVFSPDDARVGAAGAPDTVNNQTPTPQPPTPGRSFLLESATRDMRVRREGAIQRLPFSRREAESILGLVPDNGEKRQAFDFEANLSNALSREMSQYRIVHFATHGLLNSEHPELSGIILSLVNEVGQPLDGFLRLNEIYNLNLSADLVVLSACQTALGKEIKGEGLLGLTRGFMYAGSPRIVASLWKVDDVATAELMKLFYQKMFQEKMRPAAALRAAKVELWKQKRWSAPFYWAAFEIQGEWR